MHSWHQLIICSFGESSQYIINDANRIKTIADRLNGVNNGIKPLFLLKHTPNLYFTASYFQKARQVELDRSLIL